MRILIKYVFSPFLAVLVCMALLSSCGDDENTVLSGTNIIIGVKIDTASITYLLPVASTLCSLSAEGAVISLDTVSGETWYRVYVYDSSDISVPEQVMLVNKDTVTFDRYVPNHTYLFRAFVMLDTILIDSTRVATPYGNILFKDSSLASTDSGNLSLISSSPGYFVFADTNGVDFSIDITIADTAFLFAPKDSLFELQVGFYKYPSPTIINHTIFRPDSLLLAWSKVTEKYATGYRIYVRDYRGEAVDSLDVDTTVDSAYIAGNMLITVMDTLLTGITADNAYKINIAVLSPLGPGSLERNYGIDTTDTGSGSFKLPYAYFSTYSAPVAVSTDTSVIGIQGGMFMMGETWEPEYASFCPGAKPVHEVIISSFYLGKYEVTCSEYAQFLNDLDTGVFTFSGSTLIMDSVLLADTAGETWFISYVNDSFVIETGKESFPVLSVYWHGAAAYCNWLSTVETLDSCYDTTWNCNFTQNGYRLPTEAEFEYVASGAFTGYKQRFPWGYAWDPSKASVNGKSVEPVGSYGAYNGFYDLVGSAMEYVNDWSDDLTGLFLDSSSYYVASKQLGVVFDPTGPKQKTGYKHMMRGGSYSSGEAECVSYYRYTHPSDRLVDFGFRIARTAK